MSRGNRKVRSVFGGLYYRLHMAHQRGDHAEVKRIEREIEEERKSSRADPGQYYRPKKG